MSRYATIVADPPWPYADQRRPINRGRSAGTRKMKFPYPTMPLGQIMRLPVGDLAMPDAHLFLWTTHRYLGAAFDVALAWGFSPSCTLTWCKPGVGCLGGLFASTTEFAIYARRGKPKHRQRVGTTWWEWARGAHSQKPEAFLDLIEATVDGPYLEMFARRQRLGWDTWGNESFEHVEIAS